MWNVMYNVIISIVTISMLFSSIFADDAPICILFASPMCDGWRLTEEAMSVMVCPAQASLVHHFLCWHFLSSIITCNYVILCRIAWTFDIYIYIYVCIHIVTWIPNSSPFIKSLQRQFVRFWSPWFQVWEAPFTSPVFWGFLRRWIIWLVTARVPGLVNNGKHTKKTMVQITIFNGKTGKTHYFYGNFQ